MYRVPLSTWLAHYNNLTFKRLRLLKVIDINFLWTTKVLAEKNRFSLPDGMSWQAQKRRWEVLSFIKTKQNKTKRSSLSDGKRWRANPPPKKKKKKNELTSKKIKPKNNKWIKGPRVKRGTLFPTERADKQKIQGVHALLLFIFLLFCMYINRDITRINITVWILQSTACRGGARGPFPRDIPCFCLFVSVCFFACRLRGQSCKLMMMMRMI